MMALFGLLFVLYCLISRLMFFLACLVADLFSTDDFDLLLLPLALRLLETQTIISVTSFLSSFNVIIYCLPTTHPTLSELNIVIIIKGSRLKLFTIKRILLCDEEPQFYSSRRSLSENFIKLRLQLWLLATRYLLTWRLVAFPYRWGSTSQVLGVSECQESGKHRSVDMLLLDEKVTLASSLIYFYIYHESLLGIWLLFLWTVVSYPRYRACVPSPHVLTPSHVRDLFTRLVVLTLDVATTNFGYLMPLLYWIQRWYKVRITYGFW